MIRRDNEEFERDPSIHAGFLKFQRFQNNVVKKYNPSLDHSVPAGPGCPEAMQQEGDNVIYDMAQLNKLQALQNPGQDDVIVPIPDPFKKARELTWIYWTVGIVVFLIVGGAILWWLLRPGGDKTILRRVTRKTGEWFGVDVDPESWCIPLILFSVLGLIFGGAYYHLIGFDTSYITNAASAFTPKKSRSTTGFLTPTTIVMGVVGLLVVGGGVLHLTGVDIKGLLGMGGKAQKESISEQLLPEDRAELLKALEKAQASIAILKSKDPPPTVEQREKALTDGFAALMTVATLLKLIPKSERRRLVVKRSNKKFSDKELLKLFTEVMEKLNKELELGTTQVNGVIGVKLAQVKGVLQIAEKNAAERIDDLNRKQDDTRVQSEKDDDTTKRSWWCWCFPNCLTKWSLGDWMVVAVVPIFMGVLAYGFGSKYTPKPGDRRNDKGRENDIQSDNTLNLFQNKLDGCMEKHLGTTFSLNDRPKQLEWASLSQKPEDKLKILRDAYSKRAGESDNSKLNVQSAQTCIAQIHGAFDPNVRLENEKAEYERSDEYKKLEAAEKMEAEMDADDAAINALRDQKKLEEQQKREKDEQTMTNLIEPVMNAYKKCLTRNVDDKEIKTIEAKGLGFGSMHSEYAKVAKKAPAARKGHTTGCLGQVKIVEDFLSTKMSEKNTLEDNFTERQLESLRKIKYLDDRLKQSATGKEAGKKNIVAKAIGEKQPRLIKQEDADHILRCFKPDHREGLRKKAESGKIDAIGDSVKLYGMRAKHEGDHDFVKMTNVRKCVDCVNEKEDTSICRYWSD